MKIRALASIFVALLVSTVVLTGNSRASTQAGGFAHRLTLSYLAADSVPPVGPDSMPVTWHFGATNTPARQQYLRATLSDAAARLFREYGIVPHPIDVFAISDIDELTRAYVEWRNNHGGHATFEGSREWFVCDMCALSDGAAVFLHTGDAFFDESNFPNKRTGRVTIAHEYFHTVQYKLSGLAPTGPVWLFEGTADWFGWTTAAEHAKIPLTSILSWQLNLVRTDSTDLSTMDSRAGFLLGKVPYSVSMVAANLLVGERALPAILNFYQKAGAGVPWATAFEQTFGQTIEQFYVNFASYRRP